MKKSLLTLVAALALGSAGFQAVSAPARAAESSTQRAGRAAIAAAYNKQCQAVVNKDVNTLMSFYAPDYQMHTMGGRVLDRTESDAMVRRIMSIQFPGVSVNSKVSTRILSLTWRGKDAIVMCQTTAVSIATKGGRSVRTETVGLARDYWTPTSQGWKIRQTAERDAKLWLDGERIR